MRSQDYGLGGEFGALEQMLSEAGTWEPDAPAPEGLAARTMAAELERLDRERTLRGQERRAGLFSAFLLGASTVSATVAFAFIRWTSPSPASDFAATAPAPPTAIAKVLPVEGARPAGSIVSRADGVKPLRHRRPRRIAGATVPRRGLERNAVEAPVARWHEETVRHEVAGVLSSGWLVRQNPEDGSYTITPGVLDVRAGAQEACGESSVPGSEPPAVSPLPILQPSGVLDPAAETPSAPDAASPLLEAGAMPVPES